MWERNKEYRNITCNKECENEIKNNERMQQRIMRETDNVLKNK